MSKSDSYLPAAREVVYFVHLHLDTVNTVEKHSHREGHWMCRVEGKPRPMLVLQRLSKTRKNRTWFLVAPITSKGIGPNGKVRLDVTRIGNCLDSSRESFVLNEPQELPDNMIWRKGDSSPIVSPCDPMSFQNAIKVIERKMLGKK